MGSGSEGETRAGVRQSSHKSYNDESSLGRSIMASTLHVVTLIHRPYDDDSGGRKKMINYTIAELNYPD